jgi:hypothetical protein
MRPFINSARRFGILISLPILVALAFFTARQVHVNKSTRPTAPKNIQQFISSGHVLGFTAGGVFVAGGSHALHVEFVDSHATNPVSDAVPSDAQRAIPLSHVAYPNVWDGVTLTYDAPNGAIARSTYRIEPHANIDNIGLRYNAPVSVQSDGSLRIGFKTGTMNETAPQAWQDRDGKRVAVRVAFASRGEREIGFAVDNYDRSAPLFIDPTLIWNTFLGSADGADIGLGLAVDPTGDVYVSGYSTDNWGSPVRAYTSSYDGFVAKLDSNGNLLWSTFLGGTGFDECTGVTLDVAGNVFVVGVSSTSWGTPVRAYGGSEDAFAAKLDSNGNLIWNTFLGGSGAE